jgi:hypothetical protein
MRVIPSPLIADARGALGNTVFKRCAQGVVAQSRPRHQPRPCSTARTQKTIMAQLQIAWRGMTIAARQLWDAYAAALRAIAARAANGRWLSGMNVYLSINVQRRFFGLAVQSTPPTLPVANAPWTPAVTKFDPPRAQFRFDLDNLLTAETLLVYRARTRPASLNTPPSSWAYYTTFTGPLTVNTLLYLTPQPAAGDTIWFRCIRISSSRMPGLEMFSVAAW